MVGYFGSNLEVEEEHQLLPLMSFSYLKKDLFHNQFKYTDNYVKINKDGNIRSLNNDF